MHWKCPLDALLRPALREVASKAFFLWPNCLAGEAAFFGQRTKTLIRGFPCFNGLGCFLPCPGHTQFLLKGRWRGRRAGSPARRAPVQRPTPNEPRTANKAGLFRSLAGRRIDLRLAEALSAAMPKKRKNSAKQAEAFANNMKNRHAVKAAPVVAEVEQQPTKKTRGPQLGSTYRTEVNQLGLGAGHCGTTALSKRCTSIGSSKTLPLQGRQSQAGKKGGSYKQIQSSQQQQLATRLQAIASQLSTADAEFVGAAFTCIGTQGGDVVKHLMGELAAANTRADKAEAEAVDFQAQITECQFQAAQRHNRQRRCVHSFRSFIISLTHHSPHTGPTNYCSVVLPVCCRYTGAGDLSVVETGFLQQGSNTRLNETFYRHTRQMNSELKAIYSECPSEQQKEQRAFVLRHLVFQHCPELLAYHVLGDSTTSAV